MKLNKKTLSEQIYQILREDILSQRIASGTKLTLKTLIERFGVSSTPIREALTRLAEEQLVSYYSNIGVNVVELTEKDLREIYEFMGDLDALAISYSSAHTDRTALLEDLAATIAAEEAALSDICALRNNGSVLLDNKIDAFIKLSDRFHLIFYDYCGNTRLMRSAERMRSQMSIAAYQYEKNTDNLQPIHEGHKTICDACHAGRFEKAAALMKEHMRISLTYALALNK